MHTILKKGVLNVTFFYPQLKAMAFLFRPKSLYSSPIEKFMEKNSAEFRVDQLKILLNYSKAVIPWPKISYNTFHRKYSPFSRIQTTVNLINKAYQKKVICGPYLYTNMGIEVHFYSDVDNRSEMLKKCLEDEKTTIAIALRGEWSFILFRYGVSMLKFMDQIVPSFYSPGSNGTIKNLYFDEKGKLPLDGYPHGWLDEHWKIYNLMYAPREVSFKDIGERIDLHWRTVKKRYTEVLEQCKILMGFFPLGNEGYSYHVVTFKTEYEIGLYKALKKLNKTSYIYKTEDTIMLGLFLEPTATAHEESSRQFTHLEEIGLIHDLHISIPLNSESAFV
jgi:hypothetical protein